jgi:uncharacterized membrane protein
MQQPRPVLANGLVVFAVFVVAAVAGQALAKR